MQDQQTKEVNSKGQLSPEQLVDMIPLLTQLGLLPGIEVNMNITVPVRERSAPILNAALTRNIAQSYLDLKGITAKELGKLSGLHINTIGQLLKNERMSEASQVKLLRTMGCEVFVDVPDMTTPESVSD